MDHVGSDHQVAVDKLGRVGVIGVDPADPCRCQVDVIGLFRLQEIVDLLLVFQIDFNVGLQ